MRNHHWGNGRRRAIIWCAIAGATSVHVTSTIARAQISASWTATTNGGLWTGTSNWSTSPAYPTDGGGAVFGSNTRGTISVNTSISLGTLEIDTPYFGGISSRTNPSAQLTLTGFRVINLAANSAYYPNPTSSTIWVQGPTLDVSTVSNSGLTKTGAGWLTVNLDTPSANGAMLQGTIDIHDGGLMRADGGTLALGAASNVVHLSGGALANAGTTPWQVPYSIDVDPARGGILAQYLGTTTFAAPISGGGTLRLETMHAFPTGRTIDFTAANTFAGDLVHEAQLTMRLSGAGAFGSAHSITLRGDALLDNTTVAADDRLSDTATLTLNNSTLEIKPNASTAVSERVGAIVAAGGTNYFQVDASSSTAPLTITASSFTRTGHGIMQFPSTLGAGTASASSRLLLDTAPAMIGGAQNTTSAGVIPGMFIRGTNPTFVTIGAMGLRNLSSAESLATITVAGADGANINATSSQSVTSARTINSLALQHTTNSSSIFGGGTVTINSGMIAAHGDWSIGNPINFAGREAIAYNDTDVLIFTAPLSNLSGLTVGGNGSVELTNTAQTWTGPVTINGGTLFASGDVLSGQPSALGMSSDPIVIPATGAHLVVQGNLDRDVIVQSGPATLGHAYVTTNNLLGNLSGSGMIELDAPQIDGQISGDLLLDLKQSDVTITGHNTYTSGTRSVGDLHPASDDALGTGPLWLDWTSSLVDKPTLWSGAQPLHLQNDVVFNGAHFSGANPITLSGTTNARLSISNGVFAIVDTPLTIDGTLQGTAMHKQGAATLSILGVSNLQELDADAGYTRFGSNTAAPATLTILSATTTVELAPGRSTPALITSLTTGGGGGGKFDINDNIVINNYPTSASNTPALIVGEIKQGRDSGNWKGPVGITSSTAAASPWLYAIGYATQSDLGTNNYLGYPIDSTTIIFRFTYLGDANLNGEIDGSDYARIDTNFASQSFDHNITGWFNGDFDYNGKIDGSDYALIDAAFAQQSGTLARAMLYLSNDGQTSVDPNDPSMQMVQEHFAEFGADYARTFLNVPEPTLGGVVALATMFTSRHRRRRFRVR